MKKYDYILFDLDGTLSDSGLGIVNSVVYAMQQLGLEVGDRESLSKFVGPPLNEAFQTLLGLSAEQAKAGVSLYRKYYREKGILENEMYEGIEELLIKLRDAGKILAVATSKPEPFARAIIERYGIDKYFMYVGGCTLEETRSKKEEVIAYVMDCCGITDRSKAVMVGDRFYDVVGARNSGIDCIGVLYGYGERKELEEAGAAAIAASPGELAAILI